MKNRIKEGLVKRHPDGFGFFISDDPNQPDVYLPRAEMSGIMTNDRIVIEIIPERREARFRGRFVRLTSRAVKRVVGRIRLRGDGGATIFDEAHAWGSNLKIAPDATGGSKDNDLVAAEILKYPDDPTGFSGRVIAILGDIKDPLNDIQRVIHTQGIPYTFPGEVAREASGFKLEVDGSVFPNRRDLRNYNFVTIDGATAKDFDDAIFVEQKKDGFLLFVAIADVSHYVRPRSAIDEEARVRGTSVYFPNFVVPMLPEALSNELCSLKPNVDRLTCVAEVLLNFDGEVKETKFFEAVIRSKARLTYGQAQEIIDGTELPEFRHVQEMVRTAAGLAKVLMTKRIRNGSLDLEIPETEMEIDAQGNPVDMIRSERLFSHRLIEELMLVANVAVAQYFVDSEIPAIFRIHEQPDEDAVMTLQRFLHNFGGRTNINGGQLQKKISRALEAFEGTPYHEILSIITLRTMKQAKYSPANVGHFGLGFEAYTHFTSPIRRYPDLIVHRLLKACLQIKGYHLSSEEELQSQSTMLNACEQRAVKAERQLTGIKKARFLQPRLGEEFDGVISGVAKFGVFVLLRTFDVDGLIKTENLGREPFVFDDESLRLVGKKTKTTYTIGDSLRVQVTGVDVEAGQVDFNLVKQNTSMKSQTASGKGERKFGSDRKGKANRKDRQKRKPHANDHRGVRKARVSKRRRKN